MKTEEQNERLLTDEEIRQLLSKRGRTLPTYGDVMEFQDAKSYKAGIEQGKKETAKEILKIVQDRYDPYSYNDRLKSITIEINTRYLEDKQNG